MVVYLCTFVYILFIPSHHICLLFIILFVYCLYSLMELCVCLLFVFEYLCLFVCLCLLFSMDVHIRIYSIILTRSCSSPRST